MKYSTRPILIEKGIPIPEGNLIGKEGRLNISALFRQLEIGDSILLEHNIRDRNDYGKHARYVGIKVKCKQVDENNMRVWRIA